MNRIWKISMLALSLLGLTLILSMVTSKKVKAEEDEGRIGYQSTVNMTGSCTGSSCVFKFPAVPAGRRLVVEHITGFVTFTAPPGPALVSASPNASAASPITEFFFTPVIPLCGTYSITPPACSDPDISTFDQLVELYADAGQTFEVGVGPINGVTFASGGGTQSMTLTGYELNCSATPCSAIAH